MRNETRLLVDAYISRIAQLNGVSTEHVKQSFAATPSIQQKIMKKVQESSAFLSRINMPVVRDLAGKIIGLGISGTIAGRTNTETTDRLGTDPTNLDDRGYELKITHFDVAIPWAKLDMWSEFPEFQTIWADLIAQRIALDIIMCGWHGITAAASTDRVANPLLQDVNVGWLQKMRLENAARVMTEGAVDNKITYGHASGDYLTLDSMVYDARHSLLPTWAKNDTGLVAICNSGLLHDKYYPLINREMDAENTLANDIIMSTKRLGGLQAVEVPHFPDNKILITRFDNLSLYAQRGTHRRHIMDNPKRSRIEDYQSNNLGYVIEDLDYACMIENIEPYVAP